LTDDPALAVALLVAGATLLAGFGLLMVLRGYAARTIQRRVAIFAAGGSASGDETEEPTGPGSLQRLLAQVGRMVRGRTRLYSDRDIAALEGLIASGGYKPRNVLPVLLGLKVVLLAGAPAAAIAYGLATGLPARQQVMLAVFALPVGMLGPEWILSYLCKPYVQALARGVPDALDLLVVCSEAGMGLESGIEHVCEQMAPSNPAIARALASLLDDLRVLPDRREAFRNFASRTGADGARRVATMMAQSMQYGTPLSQSLRTVAADLRRERMVALEARAARLPVLLTLPLILFVMPSLFIVLLGPSFLGLTDSLNHVMGK
jgi:tight adherence protein C